ncbi:hypothetical protein PR048_000504 [Dryococelus australis]|uniref:Uncharacterized protein n=1 Tax=Dryococelus australis TaxID=614101 RepID=A0ABQ9IG05_9NEOP|nr:hypothetical protein PR048_000504 [Dryococelus australis]
MRLPYVRRICCNTPCGMHLGNVARAPPHCPLQSHTPGHLGETTSNSRLAFRSGDLSRHSSDTPQQIHRAGYSLTVRLMYVYHHAEHGYGGEEYAGAHTSEAATSGAETSEAVTSGAETSEAATSGAETSEAATSGAETSGADTSGAATSWGTRAAAAAASTRAPTAVTGSTEIDVGASSRMMKCEVDAFRDGLSFGRAPTTPRAPLPQRPEDGGVEGAAGAPGGGGAAGGGGGARLQPRAAAARRHLGPAAASRRAVKPGAARARPTRDIHGTVATADQWRVVELWLGELVLVRCCTQQEPISTVEPGETKFISIIHKEQAGAPLHASCDSAAPPHGWTWPPRSMDGVRRGVSTEVTECSGTENESTPTKSTVTYIQAVRREHCTAVQSLAISGDGGLDARGSIALIASALLGLKRPIRVMRGEYGPAISSGTIPTCENSGATPPGGSNPVLLGGRRGQHRGEQLSERQKINVVGRRKWEHTEKMSSLRQYLPNFIRCKSSSCRNLGSNRGPQNRIGGRGGVAARAFASHQGEPSSFPGEAAPGHFQLGIVPDDAAVRWVFSGFSHSPRPCIPTLAFHACLASPSMALTTLNDKRPFHKI